MNADEPILRLEGASKSWTVGARKVPVLRGIDLEVHPGRSLAIMGPSGCGKSTLLHVLGMLTPLDAGKLYFGGRCVSSGAAWWDMTLRWNIGFVFQDAKLIDNLTVLQNVCVPLAHRGIWPWRQRHAAHEALELIGLAGMAHKRPNQISGGELIRAAIARAIVTRPRVLLCDEPTGSLDSANSHAISKLLLSMVKGAGALVLVTHSATVANSADQVLQMCDGQLVVTAAPL